MKTEKVNEGFVKIGGDRLRVEAPFKIRDDFELHTFEMVHPKTGAKRTGTKWVRTKRGERLFSKGEEPRIWNFYAFEREAEVGSDGTVEEIDRWRIKREHFEGTRDEAVAACIVEFGGSI